MTKAQELVNLLKKIRNGRLGIVLHDSPDPDAIGSGLGLKKIAERFGISSDMVCNGRIMYTQNKRLVEMLGINILDSQKVDFRDYDKIAVVDVSHAGPNLTFSKDIKVNIVIDHHTSETNKEAEFVDIRNTNACSSIIVDYFRKLRIRLDRKNDQQTIITLFEGIRIDTNNLLYFNHFDIRAVEYLARYIDYELYANIRESFISEAESAIVAKAVGNGSTKNRFKIAYVAEIKEADAFGVVNSVNFLLGIEGIDTAIVYGFYKKDDNYQIIASLRNISKERDAGLLSKQLFGGGGRKESAGAKINVKGKEDLNKALDIIKGKIDKLTGSL